MRNATIDYRRVDGTRLHLEQASPERANGVLVACREHQPWCVGSWCYQVVAIDTLASVAHSPDLMVVTVEAI